jgi:hypothetical protein
MVWEAVSLDNVESLPSVRGLASTRRAEESEGKCINVYGEALVQIMLLCQPYALNLSISPKHIGVPSASGLM